MNNLPAMHFPLGARGNNFDSQIKIIYSWSKRIPFASSGPFCACRFDVIDRYTRKLKFPSYEVKTIYPLLFHKLEPLQ